MSKHIKICRFCGVSEFLEVTCPNDDTPDHYFVAETIPVERLEAIKEEIKLRLREFKKIVETVEGRNSHIWEQAKSYWYAHIIMALDHEHSYLGGSMCTMQDTINHLDDGDDENNEEEPE